MSDLDAEIAWLADLVMARHAPGGIPIERVDARSGAVVSDRFILDELGDFLQSVAALTLLVGDPRGIEWALALVQSTRAPRFRRGGLFEPFAFAGRRWRRLRGLGLAWPYWNLDSLTGLVALYELLRAAGREPGADDVRREIEGMVRAFMNPARRSGHVRYAYHPGTGLCLPLSSPQITGYVAEELARFGTLAGDRSHLDAAASLLRAECATGVFRARGLFCARIHGLAAPALAAYLRRRGKRHFFDPMLTKDNVLPAFALLALATAAPAEAAWAAPAWRRWRDAVDVHFRTRHGYYRTYADLDAPPQLTYNHSLIEWDIEAHVRTGDAAALGRAEELARRWVALQTPRGLVAESPEGRWRTASFLDPQVDLAIDLLKLGALTGDLRWTDRARDIFTAIRRDHRLSAGYAWEVDAVTGHVRDPLVEVKYLGLLLKGFLGLREIERGVRLPDAPLLWMLLRDR